MRDAQLANNVLHSPTLLVNTLTFRGDLWKPEGAMELICESFIVEPNYCGEFDFSDDWEIARTVPTAAAPV